MWVKLREVAEIRAGSLALTGTGDAVYVQARNLRGGSLCIDDAVRGPAPVRAADRARIAAGDLIVNSRGQSNRAVLVTGVDGDLFASLDLMVVRPRTDRVLPAFLAAYLNLPSTQAALAEHRTTATLPRLPHEALADLAIPLPEMTRQAFIADLSEEARRERSLVQDLMGRRERLLHEILRRAAEGAPMPSWRSAWASERPDLSEAVVGAVSTLANGVRTMSKSSGSSKGGGTRHVVPAPGGGWNNTRGGASRASSHHDTKQDAIDAARQQSRAEHSELKIHNRDGRIAQSDSHGNDPVPPKG